MTLAKRYLILLLSVLCGLSSVQLSANIAYQSIIASGKTNESETIKVNSFHAQLNLTNPEKYKTLFIVDNAEEIEEDELLSYNEITLVFADVMNAVLQAHANIYASIATHSTGVLQICNVPKLILLQIFRI